MLRIWLDHAKWIDLARAAHGRPDGARYIDTLHVARFAVRRGTASFVLDATRYMELHRRVNAASRWRLAEVMYELSRLHTLAAPRVLIKSEILLAFHEVLGVPSVRPAFAQVFGVGAGFAFGEPTFRYTVPEPLRTTLLNEDPGRVAGYESWGTELIEKKLLFGPEEDMAGESQNLLESYRFGERYVTGERELAARIAQERVGPDLFANIMSATEMIDILAPLNEIAGVLDIKLDELLRDRALAGRKLLEHIPSRVVARCLRAARHRNRQIKWKPNDLQDVGGLAFAIPYCDVVCTEKSWVHHAVAGHLDDQFSTRLN